MMKKRIMSIMLCCVMIISFIPKFAISASAETVASGTCGYMIWTLDSEGTLTIIMTGNATMGNYDKESVPWHSRRNEIKKVLIDSGLYQVDSDAFVDCPNLKCIEVEEGNPYLSSVDGVLYSNYGTEDLYLVKCPEGYEGILEISKVVGIDSGAITNCKGVTEIVIPASYLDKNGLMGFSVELSGCTNLTSLEVSGQSGYSNVRFSSYNGLLYRRIDGEPSGNNYVLYGCPPGVRDSIEILGVDGIGSYAFGECDMLSSVTLPKSLTKIHNGAFAGCSSLSDVYYRGSETAWNEIIIGSGNEALTKATIHFDTVSVSYVLLNKRRNVKLQKGKTETLVATVYPSDATNKNVLWSSSNEKVATVDSSGVVTAVGVGEATITATAEDGGYKATCKVTVLQSYSFGQSVQIGLIEPWFLKANARVYTDENPTNIDYSALVDYGVYFIRASDLSDENATQTSLSVEDIIENPESVKYSKNDGTATVDGSYITANYDKGLYTYELDDSVFVLFYVEDESGITYAPIRERNLKSLLEARCNDTTNFPNELERKVYQRMLDMFDAINAYRDDFYNKN